ncbi:MAG: hypothetical protein ACRDX8_09810, partial [Acidimicrobiales bacterium]
RSGRDLLAALGELSRSFGGSSEADQMPRDLAPDRCWADSVDCRLILRPCQSDAETGVGLCLRHADMLRSAC